MKSMALRDARTREQLLAAFADRLEAQGAGLGACWLWTGTGTRAAPNGYGQSRALLKWTGEALAHRAAYRLMRGPIPAGRQLDHLCRRTRCCNPWHLEVVTGTENVRRGHEARGPKMECKHGHPLVGDNLLHYRTSRGKIGRACRICQNAAKLAAYHRSGRTTVASRRPGAPAPRRRNTPPE